MKLSIDEELRLKHLLTPLKNNEKVQQMKKFIQHGKVTTFDHVESVTRTSFWLNRRLNLKADEESLTKGAFLHDFYLYDWHKSDGGNGLHGFSHSRTAMKNAIKEFKINRKEQNIIDSHMWPLNITKLPKCREAWIVCLADKIVSTKETIFER